MVQDEQYMLRCIDLAKKGIGNVAPNPMVGAVIVHDGEVIGEGYHEQCGQAHAEVNAINSVQNHALLPDSTIYVSLEPCSHHGKTPPCADLLVKKKFKRVVIGSRDANSVVDGKGIQRLKDAGIDVTVGVLEQECRELNKRFFTYHEKRRPYILLKWAQTTNNRIDNADHNGDVTWISVPEMQQVTHKWRLENQAILVGRKTVENDNPSLTVRAVEGKNPIRVVLDSNVVLAPNLNVFDDSSKTLIINTKRSGTEKNIEYIKVENMEVASIVHSLFEHEIQSVMIEGGATVLQAFIDAEMWDETRVIVGQHEFSTGTNAPVLDLSPAKEEKMYGDTVLTYHPTSSYE